MVGGDAEKGVMNSVDVLIELNSRYVLLVKRTAEPFKDMWALPGGIQKPFEELSDAAKRVVQQKLGLDVSFSEKGGMAKAALPQLKKDIIVHQVKTYGSGTDPRGGNTTVFALQLSVDKDKLLSLIKLSKHSSEVQLFEKSSLPKLAFDHSKFIEQYFKYLKPQPQSEKEYDVSVYERPSVTVDMIIFTIKDAKIRVLLIKRKAWPFKDMWALPGGFVEMDESVDAAALRKLKDETGVKDVYLEQLYTFGEVKRDPRTRVISVAYYALISSDKVKLDPASSAADAKWFDVDDLPKLAFDHKEILDYALERIKGKIEYTPIAFQLLPEKFTLSELQETYEAVLAKKLDKRNFRKKIKEVGLVKELKETRLQGAHRPAQLYAFKLKNKQK